MDYKEPLYRPPSEAYSLILQITLGCSHNACTFCDMYKGKKFQIKDREIIEQDILEASCYFPQTKKIFLADGNALTMPFLDLLNILEELKAKFPYLERVSAYASPKDILNKGLEELVSLKKAGLKMLYLGVESGDFEILKRINKGVEPKEMLQAGQKAIKAGFLLSVTIINGLGGKEKSYQHAINTARLLSELNPHYIGALSLMPQPKTKLYKEVEEGKLTLLNPLGILQEIKWLLDELEVENSIFRCNHASNYLPLKGTLNQDREYLSNLLARVLENPKEYNLKPEFLRGL